MGSFLQAKCNCGFESDGFLVVGGSMVDGGAICNVPYYCDHCEIVDTINIKKKNHNYSSETEDNLSSSRKAWDIKKDIKCKKCRRKVEYYGEVGDDTYFQYEEKHKDKQEYVFDWNVNDEKRYFLQDKLYSCPKCKKVNLKFYSAGCWD